MNRASNFQPPTLRFGSSLVASVAIFSLIFLSMQPALGQETIVETHQIGVGKEGQKTVDTLITRHFVDTNGDGKADRIDDVRQQDKNGDGDFGDPGEETKTSERITGARFSLTGTSGDGKQIIQITAEDTDGDGTLDKKETKVRDLSLNQEPISIASQTGTASQPPRLEVTTRDILPPRDTAAQPTGSTGPTTQKRTTVLEDTNRNGTFDPGDGVTVFSGLDRDGDGTIELVGSQRLMPLWGYRVIAQVLAPNVDVVSGGSTVSTPTTTSSPVQQPYASIWKDVNGDGVVDVTELVFDPPGTTFIATVTNAVRIPLVFPFFITSDTFDTGISASNPSKVGSRQVEGTIFDPSGRVLGTTSFRVEPQGQISKTIGELFPTVPATAVGGIVLRADGPLDALQTVFRRDGRSLEAFDAVNPLLVLSAAARGASLISNLPFVVDSDFVGSGLGLFNPDLGLHSKAASVRLELISSDGRLLGTTPLELPKNGSIVRTLGELFPGISKFSGSLRITATAPIFGIGSFFTRDGEEFSIVGLSFDDPTRRRLLDF